MISVDNEFTKLRAFREEPRNAYFLPSALFHLPVIHRTAPRDWLDFAGAHGLRLFAAMPDRNALAHFEADFRGPTAIVFGGEGNGVSAELAEAAEHIHIPMAGAAESLNVASSSAIILYEAFRQRRYNG